MPISSTFCCMNFVADPEDKSLGVDAAAGVLANDRDALEVMTLQVCIRRGGSAVFFRNGSYLYAPPHFLLGVERARRQQQEGDKDADHQRARDYRSARGRASGRQPYRRQVERRQFAGRCCESGHVRRLGGWHCRAVAMCRFGQTRTRVKGRFNRGALPSISCRSPLVLQIVVLANSMAPLRSGSYAKI